MKIDWRFNESTKGYDGYLGEYCVACVGKLPHHGEYAYGVLGEWETQTWFQAEEAAKAAAEKTVEKWLRGLFGGPVAWRFQLYSREEAWTLTNTEPSDKLIPPTGRKQALYAL